MNVYETCPDFTTPHFTLRLICAEDAPGLLRVYSDPQAQRCFNADNCTSDFCYTTLDQMTGCVNMWLWSYQRGDFVRWTILQEGTPVGTVEMFRRDDTDNGTGVLRLDLQSSIETADLIDELLRALLPAMHEIFGCECILTKCRPEMVQRRMALKQHGFTEHPQPLIGENGIAHPHYWARRHKLA